ncbi:MAG: hypothetical protein ACUZ8E_12700 [Candidatus Anammoxibacter sp.]
MKAPTSGEVHDGWVVIKEESKEWIRELSNMLYENGISSRIDVANGCDVGSCGCKFVLLVEKKDAETALAGIEEYYMLLHPEFKQSQEWVDQDKCPACGFSVGADAKECSDCGLTLLFER